MWFAPSTAAHKSESRYLSVPYMQLRYPRLARNMLENRAEVAERLQRHASCNTRAALSEYRTFRPRFLNYLVEVERDGRKRVESERRPVGPDDLTPFVLVAYCSEHYKISDNKESEPEGGNCDLDALLAVATQAAIRHFSPLPADLQSSPRAFWVSANCIPPSKLVDEHGNIQSVEGEEKEALANQDVSSSSPNKLNQSLFFSSLFLRSDGA